MATYYVRPTNGLDSNAGTSLGAAFKTTQKAMDTAVAGDVVNLVNEAIETTSSVIDLDINNGTIANPIIVQGADTSGVKLAAGIRYQLQCSSAPANLINWASTTGGVGVYWQNIDFDGNDVNTSTLLLLTTIADGRDNKFMDCRIRRSGGDGANIRGERISFIGCEVDNNAGRGLASTSSSASRWANGIVTDCKVYDNGDDGVYTTSSMNAVTNNQCWGNGGSGIKLANASSTSVCIVNHNTCYNNTVDGIELETADPNFNGVLNNTCVDNGGYGINLVGTTKNMVGMDYNHFSGNTSGAVRHNGAAVTEANVNSNGNLGANNQIGTAASALFTNVTAGSEDFIPKNGVVLDGNGMNGSDIGALPAADAAGGGGAGVNKLVGVGGLVG